MSKFESVPAALEGLQKKALRVAIVALVIFVVSAVLIGEGASTHFWQSYLTGFLFALGGTAGCLILLCIIHLAGGKWGWLIRRPLEAGAGTIWYVILLFIPFGYTAMSEKFGNTTYMDWLHPEKDYLGIVEANKLGYLNANGWTIRAIVFFAITAFIITCLRKWSLKQDETGDTVYRDKMKFIAGPGALTFVIIMTFVAVDWVSSIEPTWFSSIYGVLMMVGQALTAWAFSVLMLVYLSKAQPHKELMQEKDLHNVGKLMFAFVILWAYINLSQFIIIWSANLPEEVPWYINRMVGAWKPYTVFLVLFQFAFPFLLMLNRFSKKKSQVVIWFAVWLLGMRIIDLNWLVAPSIHQPETYAMTQVFIGNAVDIASASPRVLGPMISIGDFAAPIAFGAIWVYLMLGTLRKYPVLPTKDPVFTPDFDYKEVPSNV